MRPLCLVAIVLCCQVCLADEPPATFAAPATTPRAIAMPGGPQVLVDLKLTETIDRKEQVLAQPRLAMVSGQTAKLEVGNEMPASLPPGVVRMEPPPTPKFVGTKTQVTSIVLPDGRIRMEILVRVSDSAWQVREVETGFSVRDGQTAEFTLDPHQSIKLTATASIVRPEQAKAPAPLPR